MFRPNERGAVGVRLGVAIGGVALAALLLGTAVAGVRVARNLRDRHPGYAVDLRVAAAAPRPLAAGFAAVAITPDVVDTWTDENGNARFDEGEPWRDGDGNGRFDAFWLAGFQERRPANGVHDDVWARAMTIDDGETRIAIVVLDAIGFMHDQVIELRERIPAELEVDYAIVASTHTHQAPDLMGLWGPSRFRTGVDADHLERVIASGAEAVARAVGAERPAILRFARVAEAAAELVTDTRLPFVLDAEILALHAIDAGSRESLGSFVSWGNHPETAWDRNLLVSSDFPHPLREGLETGLRSGGRVVREGLGGTCVYASAAIGGLMTTSPEVPVRDAFDETIHREPGFAKVRAQGDRLAQLVLDAFEGDDVLEVREAAIVLRAHTLNLPLENDLLLLAAALGVLPRGFPAFGELRTEVAALSIGPATFLAVPGEIYPEIVNGGIEAPDGRDFEIGPLETPPLRALMPGEFRFVIGLANDAIGYIIPKSEWDAEEPWIYGADEETYGEIVSAGPGTAPAIHAALRAALAELDVTSRSRR